jgi:para-aminobenzoate synthetase / 4-amino-4-deoxychorismate lyase
MSLDLDHDRGLFETVLVVDGAPVRLDAHLARMGASLGAIYGAELPGAVRTDAFAAARGLPMARMRIDLAPDGEGFRHTIVTTIIDPAIFFPDRAAGADLRSVHQPAWVGAHKLADRDWLESVELELGDEAPLILGAAEEVLEGGRANVFIVRDEELATPPLDGRILPGTARAATLALAADLGVPAHETTLFLPDLRAADEVFLTSSLRGIRPARRLDGEPLRQSSPLVPRLQEKLRARWLGQADPD